MDVKKLIRPLPGVRNVSLLRQRLSFLGSQEYWEANYAHGGTSGGGSYGTLACAKAEFLNTFVQGHDVMSVTEFGCGDGHQLSLANYGRYVGLDVSRAAIAMCKHSFRVDQSKSFFLYDGECFVDNARLFAADLAISLDVVYHLVEDSIFELYMRNLFAAGLKYVIIYSTNKTISHTAPHVRHRHFTPWVDINCPEWKLLRVIVGPDSGPAHADFFVYRKF